MPTEDVTFTFNPRPFQRGVEAVQNSMDSIQSGTKSMAKGMQMGLMRVVRRVGGLAAAFMGVRSVMKQMPEIGQAFSIAGEVLTKNLFWPLRKMLFPLLQRMLDWVRDHRGMFVKWGEGIVGILKGAWEIAKTLWDALKGVAGVFKDVFQRLFPFLNRSVSDTLNLLQFKMVLTARLLGDIFEKVAEFWQSSGLQSLWDTMFETVGNIVEFTREMAMAFGRGFLSNIEGVKDAFSGLVSAVEELWVALFGGEFNVDRWANVFESIGRITSEVIEAAIRQLTESIKGLAEFIGMIREEGLLGASGILLEREGYGRGPAEERERAREKGSLWEQFIAPLRDGGATRRFDDFIMRPGQPAVAFSPQDTILGTKDPTPTNINPNISIDMSGTQIYVTEGNAEAAGRNFGVGLGEQIRQELLDDMTRAGE